MKEEEDKRSEKRQTDTSIICILKYISYLEDAEYKLSGSVGPGSRSTFRWVVPVDTERCKTTHKKVAELPMAQSVLAKGLSMSNKEEV